MGQKLPPASPDVVLAGTRRPVHLDDRRESRQFAILEPSGAVVEMDPSIGGALPAADAVGQAIWALPLWNETTREQLRHHIAALAKGGNGSQPLCVPSPWPDSPAILTLRPIQTDQGDVTAIVMETTALPDAEPGRLDMVPRQFVEDIAHQLNNALASVLGNLELIERRSQDNDAVMARIPRAREALDRAFSLIQSMRR